MPTEAENIQFLYLVLTSDGHSKIDCDKVGEALGLTKGAVSKRWSRLKQSLDKGETPGGTAYHFLWTCVKHNCRDKALNWLDIADKCNTTPGAASKRYSRMKQAFETIVPSPDALELKETEAVTSSNESKKISPSKRKRNTPKNKAVAIERQKSGPALEDHDVDCNVELPNSKRAKATTGLRSQSNPKDKKNKTIKQELRPPTPTTEATTLIKGEHDEDEFYDTNEKADDLFEEGHQNALDRL